MVNVKIEKVSLTTENVLRPTQSTQPDSFSLAHISDLHLTSLDNIKIPQLLSKRILGYLSWLHKRRLVHRREIIASLLEDLRDTHPDHIAVTGDMTHLGLPMEYTEVEQWLPSLGTPEHVTVIPGNHDAYAGKAWGNSCSSWRPYLDSDTKLDIPKTAGFFPSLRIRGQIALIGLSSARPTLPLLATGTIGQKQLSGLDILLEKTGEEGLFRVVMVHHPPVPGLIKWRKRLTDDKMFAAVLARQGAELVLHGHAHTATISKLQTPTGSIPVVGAPSASELNPWTGNCAKYNIYRISRSGKNWELTMTVHGYSEDQGRFVSTAEKSLRLPQR